MITLVLGGTRSGKSAVAETLARQLPGPVTYVATMTADPADADLRQRIAAHRARRPATWGTLEVPPAELSSVLATTAGTVLVDSLGAWVASASHGAIGFAVDLVPLVDALTAREGDSVLVSDEVGLGVHPSSEVGRRFRDVLGEVNQAVAARSDEVLLVVAGRVLPLVDLSSR